MRTANAIRWSMWALVVVLLAGAGRAEAVEKRAYLLWTPAEVEVIRQQIADHPWAQQQAERIKAGYRKGDSYCRLFRAVILDDEKAAEQEKKYLLGFIGAKIGESRRHTMYMHAVRYDTLYDRLTAEQRKKIEATFRRHIQHELDHPNREDQLSWLPNMQWPRMLSAHVMAVALGDEKLIREVWNAPTGFKWYMDEYLADGGLYFEEFGKIDSCVGAMMIACRGLDRLGLSEIGYDYVGEGGASMKNYVQSLIWLGYPRTETPSGLHHYPIVTMGDAKGNELQGSPRFLAQRAIVPGMATQGAEFDYDADLFFARNMNGRDHRMKKVNKLGPLHWFEMLHQRYPDEGFDYFLAQFRRPGDEVYQPTLFWGVDAIDPAKVQPPAAPSKHFPERGLTMLRAEQSPAYWESEAPAVALQHAKLYVHYVADAFSLLGFHAYNRPIYLNRTISRGYNGGPYDFHVRSHAGVVVDNLQAQPIGPVKDRHRFGERSQFVSIRTPGLDEPYYKGRGEVRSSDQTKQPAKQVYPGVELERALVLNRAYLFDVFRLTSEQQHDYHWLVHALGEFHPEQPDAWADSQTLQQTLFKDAWIDLGKQWEQPVGGEAWTAKVVQSCALEDVGQSVMGRDWYDRKVGVRVMMLGAGDGGRTTAFAYHTPTTYEMGHERSPRSQEAYEAASKRSEVGGISIAAHRRAAETTFVTLHEPFEGGEHRIQTFERLAETDNVVAVRIIGKRVSGIDDIIAVAIGDEPGRPRTVTFDGSSITFTDHIWLRLGDDAIEAEGGLEALRLTGDMTDAKALTLNGEPVEATSSGGTLRFKR